MIFGFRNKVAKQSFSAVHLPSNRKELFLDILINRFWFLVKLGCILLLFTFPFLFVSTIKELTINGIILSLEDGLVSKNEATKQILYTSIQYDFFNLISFVILSIGLAGIVKIIKLLIWGEGIVLRSDFISGMKQNMKQYTLLFFTVGLVCLINNSVVILVGSQNESMNFLGWLPTLFATIILLPISAFCFSQIPYYQNTFIQNVLNGAKFYILNSGKTLSIILLCCFTWVAIIFIPMILVKFILLILSVILILPIVFLIWFLYSNHLFDRYINTRQYPDIINKGLWKKDVSKE